LGLAKSLGKPLRNRKSLTFGRAKRRREGSENAKDTKATPFERGWHEKKTPPEMDRQINYSTAQEGGSKEQRGGQKEADGE